MKILPSITTTSGADTEKMIGDVGKYNLKEVCFFPTTLKLSERKKIYRFIEKSAVKLIPYVHIRSDFESWELDYFIDRYKTELFSLHSKKEFDNNLTLKKYYKTHICLENTRSEIFDELSFYKGICFDSAHLENAVLMGNKVLADDMFKSLVKYPVCLWHISSINRNRLSLGKNRGYDSHSYSDLSEFDYLAKYKQYGSELMAMELENTIKEQLTAIDYVNSILSQ